MRKGIYLDYAATTPVAKEVFEAMRPYLTASFANPSSIHTPGKEARVAVEEARNKVAQALEAQPSEIIFTSCATEADNLAIKGVVEACKHQKPHLIVSPIEHHAVLDTVKHLQKQGVEVTWLSVDKDGLVDPREIKQTIKENTVLVSVMYGNNEIGTIEPIEEIGKLIKAINVSRLASLPRRQAGHLPHIYFHTDAVQAFGYLDCQVDKLGVDLLCLSAHKFYGPKGVGVLYVRKGTPLVRQQDGGFQESNRRAGTENVAGIVGMGCAIEMAQKIKNQKPASPQGGSKIKNIEDLRDRLTTGVLKNVAGAVLTGHPQKRLPHIASFVIPGAEGEAILLLLDEEGVAASSGSACTSGLLEPSHVLMAMGFKPEDSHGSLRFSLGHQTTEEEVDFVVEILPGIVEKLRKMAPKL